MSQGSEGDLKELILSDKISAIENFYADNILSEPLKEIYAEVQYLCSDFRNNVFFKTIDVLDENAGTLDKVSVEPCVGQMDVDIDMKSIKLYPENLKELEEKCKNY